MVWWIIGASVALAAGAVVWGRFESGQLRLSRQVVRSSHLPAAFEGFRIVHLSDLHYLGDRPAEARAAALVHELQPDLVVFTGDLIGTTEAAPRAVGYLAALRGRRGAFAVLGNHDRRLSLAEGWLVEELEARGVRVLCNEHVVLREGEAEVWIVGLDDPHQRFASFDQAMAGVPANAFRLMLAHTPRPFRRALEVGIDLILCGHTHGGQVRLPGIGPLYFNVKDLPRALAAGRTALSDRTMLIVSHGIGLTWYPIRICCPPEVVLIELRRADAPAGT